MLKKSFYIDGMKKILFDLTDNNAFIFFDPIRLTYFEIDNLGGEILYSISKKMKLSQIVELVTEEYDISKLECRKKIIKFLNDFPIQDIIYTNLIQSDIYLYLDPFDRDVEND